MPIGTFSSRVILPHRSNLHAVIRHGIVFARLKLVRVRVVHLPPG